MYIKHNILVHSHNHCCSGNAIMYYVCVVWVCVCIVGYISLKLHKNIMHFMTMLLWHIYETVNNGM